MHSSLAGHGQKQVFKTPPDGIRKIVIATNIAETSITIPDVTIVIDTGKMKEIHYNSRTKMSSLLLKNISKANAKQREGRAGRVAPGICFRLLSKELMDSLPSHGQPEMLRMPLEELCLHILDTHPEQNPIHFLACAISPPNKKSIINALITLEHLGAISKTVQTKEQNKISELELWSMVCPSLTPLGKNLAKLPVDVRLGRMLLFGAMLQCLDPILTITAAITCSRSIWKVSLDNQNTSNTYKKGDSDHLVIYRAYQTWVTAGTGHKRHITPQKVCQQWGLHEPTLRQMKAVKKQLLDLLTSSKFIDNCDDSWNMHKKLQIGPARVNKYSNNEQIIKAAISAGLYPNVVCIQPRKKTFGSRTKQKSIYKRNTFTEEGCMFTEGKERREVWVNPSSVNYQYKYLSDTKTISNQIKGRWMMFQSKQFTNNRIMIRSCTIVPSISLILFGKDIGIFSNDRAACIDGWMEMNICSKTCILLLQLQQELEWMFEQKLQQTKTSNTPLSISKKNGSSIDQTETVVDIIASLLKESFT